MNDPQVQNELPTAPAAVRRLPDGPRVLLGFLTVPLPFPLGLLLLKGVIMADTYQGQFNNELLRPAGMLVIGMVVLTLGARARRFAWGDCLIAAGGVGAVASTVVAYLLLSATPPHNDPPPASIWPNGIVEAERELDSFRGAGGGEVIRHDENHLVLLRLDRGMSQSTGCDLVAEAVEDFGWTVRDESNHMNGCWTRGSAPNDGAWSVMTPENLGAYGMYHEWIHAEDHALVFIVF